MTALNTKNPTMGEFAAGAPLVTADVQDSKTDCSQNNARAARLAKSLRIEPICASSQFRSIGAWPIYVQHDKAGFWELRLYHAVCRTPFDRQVVIMMTSDEFPIRAAVLAGELGLGPKIYEWTQETPKKCILPFHTVAAEYHAHNMCWSGLGGAEVTCIVMEYLPNARFTLGDDTLAWPIESWEETEIRRADDPNLNEHQLVKVTMRSGNRSNWMPDDYEREGAALLRRLGMLHRSGIVHGNILPRKVIKVLNANRTDYEYVFIGFGEAQIYDHPATYAEAKDDLSAVFEMLTERVRPIFFKEDANNDDFHLTERGLAEYEKV